MEKLTEHGLAATTKHCLKETDMEKLLAILKDINPDVDFLHTNDLVASGVLDSLSLVMLVARLNMEFDIEITPLDLIPENFHSAQAIWALIQRLED